MLMVLVLVWNGHWVRAADAHDAGFRCGMGMG